MKKLAVLCVIVVFAAFAAETDLGQIEAPGGSVSLDIPPPDVLYDTGELDMGLLVNGVATAPSYSWVSADDFVLEDDSEITDMVAYVINYQGVSGFGIRFWDDSGNGPGDELDRAPGTFELTSTGQYQWGYLLYQCDITFDTAYELDSGHYWFAGGYTSGFWYWLCQANSYDDMVYFSQNDGASWQTSQSAWGQAYDFFFTINGEAGDPDIEPPFVEGMDPDDGEVEVPVDSTIVFHCVDLLHPVVLDTIDFIARDTSLTGGRALGAGSSNRVISGDLDLDDTDPLDVVCTFTPDDEFYEGDTITCTVAAGLADTKDNEMEEDFVWSFDVWIAVEEATWGQIKAGF